MTRLACLETTRAFAKAIASLPAGFADSVQVGRSPKIQSLFSVVYNRPNGQVGRWGSDIQFGIDL
jgi:hypothetical protein